MTLKNWKVVRGNDKLGDSHYASQSYRKLIKKGVYGNILLTVTSTVDLTNPKMSKNDRAIWLQSYIVSFLDIKTLKVVNEKYFKTKSQALAYAKAYMRKH